MGNIGAYIYGIVSCDRVVSLEGAGGDAVVTIPANDLAAVMHWCDPMDYRSDNPETIRKWVITHQNVVDLAWKRFGNILPMHFGTIVTGDDKNDVIGKTVRWIDEGGENFGNLLSRVRGRAEYGVQIFWDSADLKESIIRDDPELRERRATLNNMSEGIAYLKRQGLEAIVRERLTRRIDERRRALLEEVRPLVEDLNVEQCDESSGDNVMILKVSCLADDDQTLKLGCLLEEFEKRPGFSVRFTGPWPPYSFVSV